MYVVLMSDLRMCVDIFFVKIFFFFFKQMTAYEMRISDWSSDVCSSDLAVAALVGGDLATRGVDAQAGRAAQGVDPPDAALRAQVVAVLAQRVLHLGGEIGRAW